MLKCTVHNVTNFLILKYVCKIFLLDSEISENFRNVEWNFRNEEMCLSWTSNEFNQYTRKRFWDVVVFEDNGVKLDYIREKRGLTERWGRDFILEADCDKTVQMEGILSSMLYNAIGGHDTWGHRFGWTFEIWALS